MSSIADRSRPHEARIAALGTERAALEAKANRISLARLTLFVVAASLAVAGLKQGAPALLGLGAAVGLGFFAAVVWHARVIASAHEVSTRIAIHGRQLKRIHGASLDGADGREHLAPDHPYASDIDLVGAGSLFQRIDVSQTREGEAALALALSTPAAEDVILARQAAVQELAEKAAFREELELRGAVKQQRGQKLDHAPFMTLFQRPSVFAAHPWLKPAAVALLSATLISGVLAQLGVVSNRPFWLCLMAQAMLLYRMREPVHETLDLVTARIGSADAYRQIFKLIEDEAFRAPHLQQVKQRLSVQGAPPSAQMARLSRYEGFAQLRTQGPVYLVLNVLTLWDLWCLDRIERFAADLGPHCEVWFRSVGELELLSSLATLHHSDPGTTFPSLVSSEVGLEVLGLAHPLLPVEGRVANDVSPLRPGTSLLVTGSNMAGKSTLLRALGLNVALALAGGPVCARAMRLPLVRLRASMRIEDSLQRGASYFHAELSRLRMVVSELDKEPPVFFLLDELLRGTNARARHQGARAVLLHLLARGAMGVVATHDVALSELEAEFPGKVTNVHFTDVFEAGEMRFDYKLRDGVVKTSNALRLLAMAGVDVEIDDLVS